MVTPNEGEVKDPELQTEGQELIDVDGSKPADAVAEQAQERAYSQAEWDDREKSIAAEFAAVRTQSQQRAAQAEFDALAAKEGAAWETDLQALTDGDITKDEVVSRQSARLAKIAEQRNRVREDEVRASVMQQGELLGKVMMAMRLGKELGIDPDILINDKSITNQSEMRLAARELAITQREAKQETELKGTEKFDHGAGQPRATGVQSYVDKLKSGSALPSAAEIDRITARFLKR